MNIKITAECPTENCNHTIQFFPSADVLGLYQATCGACEAVHEAIVLTVAEMLAHDLMVTNAVKEEKAKK